MYRLTNSKVAFWAIAWYWAFPTRVLAVIFSDSGAILRFSGTVALTIAAFSLTMGFLHNPKISLNEKKGLSLILFLFLTIICGLLVNEPVSWSQPLPYLFLFLIGILLRPTVPELKLIGTAFLIGCFAELFATAYVAYTGSVPVAWQQDQAYSIGLMGGRLSGLRVDANTFAVLMASATNLLFFIATTQNTLHRTIFFAVLGMLFAGGLFLSASRTGMVVLLAGILMILFLNPSRIKLSIALKVVFFLALTLASLNWSVTRWDAFYKARSIYESRLLLDSRLYTWKQYFRLPPPEYMLFGIGWKSVQTRFKNDMMATPYIIHDQTSHNIFLLQLHEGGILGLSAFILLIFSAIRISWKHSCKDYLTETRQYSFAILLLLLLQLTGGLALSDPGRLTFFLMGLSFTNIRVLSYHIKVMRVNI